LQEQDPLNSTRDIVGIMWSEKHLLINPDGRLTRKATNPRTRRDKSSKENKHQEIHFNF
jgi:hypothetical protein